MAMTDFAAACAAVFAHFASAEVGEVVVQYEGLLEFAARDVVKFLCIAAGAQCGGDESLRVASLEEGAAMSAWKQTNFAADWAYFV